MRATATSRSLNHRAKAPVPNYRAGAFVVPRMLIEPARGAAYGVTSMGEVMMAAAKKPKAAKTAVGKDGYVRVTPTWSSARQLHLGDSPGIGRQIGWLLGAMIGAPLMLSVSSSLPFWQVLLGIAACSIIGAVIGHVVARLIWSKVKVEVPATNPRLVMARDVQQGMWLMTQNDGTNRAMQALGDPVEIPDPLGDSREPEPTVSLTMSTGRELILPAEQDVTVVDLPDGIEPRWSQPAG